MAVTASSVKAFAPEFASLADAQITTWIGFASGAVGGLPAAVLDQATTLWTCHQLTRTASGAGGTVGPVTERRVGDVSIGNSGSDSAQANHGYRTTGYGVALMQLIRRYTAGGQVV